MKKSKVLAVALITLTCLSFLILTNTTYAASAPPAKSINIRFTGHMPTIHHNTAAALRFIDEVEKRSNGILKFTYYPAGQLAMDVKAIELCQRGAIEMAQTFPSRASGIIPEGDLLYPYFDDPDWYARRLYDTSGGGGLWYKIIIPKFQAKNLHLLPGPLNTPEHSGLTKKKVVKMDDYKGLKIRISSRAIGAAIASWGAQAVVMSSSETYQALQRNTIDGALSGVTSIKDRKWYEIADHVQLLWMACATLDTLVNMNFWKGLSDDHRNIIREAARNSTIWSWEQAIAELNGDIEFLKSKGLNVIDFKQAYTGEWVKMKDAAMGGLAKEIGPTVGKATWDETMRCMNNTQQSKKTWQEIFKTMEW
jgi:TRAP-type C4-dicarboxylate transport system substrate-binding protein